MEVLPSGSPSSQIVTPGENLRAISIWVNVNSSFKSELINNADVIFVEQGMLYLYDTRSLECGAHETDCRWSLQSMHEARHTNTCTPIMENHKNLKGGKLSALAKPFICLRATSAKRKFVSKFYSF